MSIFDHPDVVPTAPTWRCPHCGTLQPETTRCWACSKSPVACGTCRFFRSSVASELSYCGLDRAHAPVGAEDVRTCWKPHVDGYGVEAGMFSEDELQPAEPPEFVATEPVPGLRQLPNAGSPAAPVSSTMSNAEPEGATVASSDGGLIEAPHVPPGRRVISEAGRRARLGRFRRSTRS